MNKTIDKNKNLLNIKVSLNNVEIVELGTATNLTLGGGKYGYEINRRPLFRGV